jgi:hypothetical protein
MSTAAYLPPRSPHPPSRVEPASEPGVDADATRRPSAHGLSDRLFSWLPRPVKERWPTIRAVLIGYHVIAVCVLGFPAPAGVMDKSAWKEPSVQNELRIWAERANSVGFSWTQDEFEQLLWDFSKTFLAGRKEVLRPFVPYAEYLGTRQDWRMFSAPHRYPSRNEIHVRIGGEWKPVFVSRSDEHTWNRFLFDHHRIRRLNFLHAWKKYGRRYKTFTHFVARKAAADFPEADQVRVRFYKYRTPTPEERRAGHDGFDGKYIHRRVHKLDEFRPGGKHHPDTIKANAAKAATDKAATDKAAAEKAAAEKAAVEKAAADETKAASPPPTPAPTTRQP